MATGEERGERVSSRTHRVGGGRLAWRVVIVVALVLAGAWLFLSAALGEQTRQQVARAAGAGATTVAQRVVESGAAPALLSATTPSTLPDELHGEVAHLDVLVWRDDGVLVGSTHGADGVTASDASREILQSVTEQGRVLTRTSGAGETAQVHAYAPAATTADGAGLVVELTRDLAAVEAGVAGGNRLVALTLGGAMFVIGALLVPLLLHHDRTLRERTRTLRTLLQRESDAVERMNEVDRAKNDFLTAISHELRTPLQVIDGLATAITRRGDQLDPERLRHLAERLSANARRLDELITDLLDVDRLARGGLEPRRHPVDVALLSRDVVARFDATDHPIHLPDDSVVASVDPGHVERIVEHLVRNALKYTPPGSPVWIELLSGEGVTELVVSDAGPGIPEELRLRVFDPLFRIADDRPDPGAGLGLALVRRLAEQHGGRAWVEDRAGGGAAFHVLLPDEGAAAPSLDPWLLSAGVPA